MSSPPIRRGSRWKHFRYEEAQGVATVTFDRPERLNALTFDVYADLCDLTRELAARGDEVRVLILRGQGRGFCSGGDVEEIIGKLLEMDTRGVYDFARMTGACVRHLREMPQPVIASVNGIAAGAGAVLACACDFRVLAAGARFEFLFTRVGISGGDMGVCWLLPRLVGLGRATEILMLGDRIGAQQAVEIGLASQAVEDDALDDVVGELASRLVERAPWGLAMTKEMLNRSAATDYSTAIEMEAWTQSLLMTAHDFQEFHAAFAAKRKPVYRGR